MEHKEPLVVDLASPEAYAAAHGAFLSMGVAQVTSAEPLELLSETVVRILLPGGRQIETGGRVLQAMGASFIVELVGAPPLPPPGEVDRLLAAPADESGGEGADARATDSEADATGDEDTEPSAAEAVEGDAADMDDLVGEDDDDAGREPVRHKTGPLSGLESSYSDAYSRIRTMTIGEKRMLAPKARRTVRQLLIKDPAKSLHILVVKNPRVTKDEILEYSKMPGISRDAIMFIAQNRSWMGSKQLAFNLVKNPSTPMDVALRLMHGLTMQQLIMLTKGDVRGGVAQEAKRRLAKMKGLK